MTMELRARSAAAADYPTFARLFPELAVPDPLPTPEQFVERMLARVIIVEDDDGPAGYGFYQVYGKSLHVVHVVAAKEARGRGVGASIMNELRRRADIEGCTRWFLNVKQDNASAIKVYERSGMTKEVEGWTLRMPWSALTALPDAPSPTTISIPTLQDDEALAARFDLDAARLDVFRQRPNVVLRVLSDTSGPRGFAAFDPAFPGVYPIRVPEPSFVKPLLEELHPFAKHDYANVWVEQNAALKDLLIAAGATMQFSIFRMAAAL